MDYTLGILGLGLAASVTYSVFETRKYYYPRARYLYAEGFIDERPTFFTCEQLVREYEASKESLPEEVLMD